MNSRKVGMTLSSDTGWADSIFDDLRSEIGYLDARVFTDERIYQLELERIFTRSWLCVAHSSQVEKPGDFVLGFMGEDPVVVMRQDDSRIRVFLNQCKHRGMPICSFDRGNLNNFVCPYHGWSYDRAGRLVQVPSRAEAYEGSTLDGIHLTEATVQTFRDLIFATWDPSPTKLEDHLGEFCWYLDAMLDRCANGTVIVGEVTHWQIDCNWKLAAEQFCSDMYHAMTTHMSAALANLPANTTVSEALRHWSSDGVQARSTTGGHGCGMLSPAFLGPAELRGEWGMLFGLASREASRFYWGAGYEQAKRRVGEFRATHFFGAHMTVFPTLSLLPGMQVIRVWHPRGPGRTRVTSMTVVDRDCPHEAGEAWRTGTVRSFGPSGVFEQDDANNLGAIQTTLRGYMARKTRFHARMGRAVPNTASLPGLVHSTYSESAARGFYSQWARLMSGGNSRGH